MIYSHVKIYYEVECDSCSSRLEIYDYNGKRITPKFTSMKIALSNLKEYNWNNENGKITCLNCIKKKLRARYK